MGKAAVARLLTIAVCLLVSVTIQQACGRELELERHGTRNLAAHPVYRGVSRHGESFTHAQHVAERDVSDADHAQTMCIEPVDTSNLDCHILGKVGKIDPYLLHRQHVGGQLPAVSFNTEECGSVVKGSRKAVFDKIVVAPRHKRRRPGTRVLCMVVTTSDKHDSDLRDVRMTWGHKCGGFIAFSNATDRAVSAIQTPVAGGDSYRNLGEKTRAMFKYAWYHFGHMFDWFFKADDDTFVIMENLIQYLGSEEIQRERRSGKGVYLGHRMKIPREKMAYTSGGGGYLLDRVATKEFVNNMEKHKCQSGAEDLQVGKCLFKSDIVVYNTTDAAGEEMFHPFSPSSTVDPERIQALSWYVKYRPMGIKLGMEAVSANTTTFHYMRGGAQMKAYQYLTHCKSPQTPSPSQE